METPSYRAVPEWLHAAGANALTRGAEAGSFLAEEWLRAARAGLYFSSHALESALPAFSAFSDMREDVLKSFLDTVAGRRSPAEHWTELSGRVAAGARYRKLVHTLGKELLGTATYAGEQVLAANDVYRLSYLPPKAGAPATDAAIFFVAGFIPYGDRLFRFLPEASLYERYLERGIPVYAMELAADGRDLKGLGGVTVERQIDWIDEMAATAQHHNGGRRMIAQGYCGSGTQLVAYLCARPKNAEAKFSLASLFVTPVDAKRCTVFAETMANMPRSAAWTSLARSQVTGGYLRGLEMWAGLDLSLKNIFVKTWVGRFASGWKNPAWANVRTVADLAPMQRFELAGAYWISVDNARRFPLPVDLVRKAMHLYDKGVGADGLLGAKYRGRDIGIADLARESSLRVVSFFGGQDKLVQEESGAVLKSHLGPRYRAIVHPAAGHVSYICFPSQWSSASPKAFAPNPIDVLLAESAAAKAA